jgi:hypothetical protein
MATERNLHLALLDDDDDDNDDSDDDITFKGKW